MTHRGKAIVAGGSIGGLLAGAALMKAGWEVVVYERSQIPLAGRGAGIVTHETLFEALRTVGASTADLGVHLERRIAIDKDGKFVASVDYPQVVTSWDRLHNILREKFDMETYRLGHALAGFEADDNGVVARFMNGHVDQADVLVGADGFRSSVRAALLPEVTPQYSGYVVWRTVIDEARLPTEVHKQIFNEFCFFMPANSQVVAYPIAGLGNDLREGHRRYNFVWYVPAPEDELDEMLTGPDGRRYDLTIPPPEVRNTVVEAMKAYANETLPEVLSQVVMLGERAFFTPIYDHWSPTMAQGRVALTGDAACVARPHVGMGVTKAAQDALALANHVSLASPVEALKAYSAERVPRSKAAFERSRKLGDAIFSGGAAANPDGGNHPDAQMLMVETASDKF
ncbi:MAG: FAD-dependent monooxygenase [Pseudomonadota bacterium]